MLGIKSKILNQKTYSGTCPHCGNAGTVTLYVSQNSTHFLGIPYWPLKKIAYSHCQHCKQALAEKEMPSMMHSEALPMLKAAKTPIWSYGGLIFIFGCFAYGLYSAYATDKRTEKLVLEPKVGDVYYTNFNVEEYGAMKIVKVGSDSVFFTQTRFVADKKEGITQILKKENPYEIFEVGFSKSELADDAKHNKIIDIKR